MPLVAVIPKPNAPVEVREVAEPDLEPNSAPCSMTNSAQNTTNSAARWTNAGGIETEIQIRATASPTRRAVHSLNSSSLATGHNLGGSFNADAESAPFSSKEAETLETLEKGQGQEHNGGEQEGVKGKRKMESSVEEIIANVLIPQFKAKG